MKSEANSPDAYYAALSEERRAPMDLLRKLIKDNIPGGFVEQMNYGMPGWVVPKTIFPEGYHCDPSLPLSFINIASQKNFIALYHMGIYASPELYNWFVTAYPQHCKSKIDMGKSCIRFKKPDDIPYELIGELVRKMTVEQWINLYQKMLRRER